MKKKILSVMLIAAMAVSFAAGCGSRGGDAAETAPGTAPAGEGVLRISQSSGGALDPAVGSDCASSIAYVNLYDALAYTDLNNESQPQLAEKWDMSEDGSVWTFHLRKDAKFHDGSGVLASVYKKHIFFIEIGENRRKIGCLFYCRSRRDANLRAHFACNDMRKRRLAKSGRTE